MPAGAVDVLEVIVLLLVELAEQAREQHLREADDGVERRAELVRHRGQERRLVLVGHLELASLLANLAHEARVLDGDDRLVGKGAQERDLLVGEAAGRGPADDDRADGRALPHHRRDERRAHALAAPRGEREGRHRRIALDVGKVNDAARADRKTRRRVAADREGKGVVHLLPMRPPVRRHAHEAAVVDNVDLAHVAREQALAALEDRLEHGLGVGDGTRDRAQDLADRRLLLERVRELVRALLDLALEARVRLAELRRHAVEALREALELVAGAHDDPLVEVPLADALRALGQRADGADHAAREDERAHRGDDEAREEQKRGAQDRRVELRVHLRHRLLREDRPVERIDACVRGQHVPAREVGRHRRLALLSRRLERGLHVRKLRHVRLAQHETDVRVGDEEALAVDDVRLALVADLDARHHVPDELEVDVGDGDGPGVAARAHADRHVGLGLLPEIDGADVGLAALRVAERRLLRAVLAGPDHVHPEARHRDLLATLRVELRDVGHFRHLAQELQELDAAKLDVARVELRERGVGELLVDLAHVLLDARRRRHGLLLLQVAHRGLLLLVGEIEADAAGHEERAAHEREDEDQVLPEKPPLARCPRRRRLPVVGHGSLDDHGAAFGRWCTIKG